MTFFQAIVLGIFQGISEFLPISSSGHLVLLQHFFKIKEGNLFFTEMLHFGTLISIIIVYFKDIIKIIVEFFKMIGKGIKEKKFKITNIYQKFALMIIVGSIPTAIIGILFKDFFEKLYSSTLAIGIAFLVTGCLLWVSDKKAKENTNIDGMTGLDATVIGTFQGIAIIPGISRSGSTIVAGLLRGLKRPLATEYSFLLALPATFGAGILGIKEALEVSSNVSFTPSLIVGMIISTIVGIYSLKLLINLLKNKKLHYFSYYLWILGVITIISQLV